MKSIALASALLAMAGCGDVAGEGDFPGATTYTAEDLSFRLRYLDPPWRWVEPEDAAILRLVAEVRGGALGDTAADVPTHVLDITVAPAADSLSACSAAIEEARALGGTIEIAERHVENFYGDVGYEFVSRDPMGLRHRDAFFIVSDGRVLRLGFGSALDTDDAGIDVVISGFEPL